MQNKRYTIQFFSPPLTDCAASPQAVMEELRELADPCPTLISVLSMTSVVWNISVSQLGRAAWLCSLPAPAHLLISWTWETGKSPRFLSNNDNHQCVINIILLLNPKHRATNKKINSIPAKTRTASCRRFLPVPVRKGSWFARWEVPSAGDCSSGLAKCGPSTGGQVGL